MLNGPVFESLQEEEIFFLQKVPTGSGVHTAFLSVGIWFLYRGLNRPGCEYITSPHVEPRLRMSGVYLYSPPYASMAWSWTALCLFRHVGKCICDPQEYWAYGSWNETAGI